MSRGGRAPPCGLLEFHPTSRDRPPVRRTCAASHRIRTGWTSRRRAAATVAAGTAAAVGPSGSAAGFAGAGRAVVAEGAEPAEAAAPRSAATAGFAARAVPRPLRTRLSDSKTVEDTVAV